MDEEFIFKQSAFKHGIEEADIRHAFQRRVFDYCMEEDKNLLIGLARNGILIEIMYNVLSDNIINVFHAMKCRKSYLVLLRRKD